MKDIFYTTILLMVSLISNNLFSQEFNKSHLLIESVTVNCKLKGNVIGGNSKYLMLVNEKDDPFHSGVKIPIVDGHFEHDLQTPFSEKYTLILGEELENAAFRPISFFAENNEVEFTLHSAQEFDKNTIVGGRLNDKMVGYKLMEKKVFDPVVKPFRNEIDSLWGSKNYFSKEANTLFEMIKSLGSGEELNKLYKMRDELLETENGYTPRVWVLNNKMDSIQKLKFEWEVKYIESNQDFFSYSLLLDKVRWYKQNKKNIDLSVLTQLAGFSL